MGQIILDLNNPQDAAEAKRLLCGGAASARRDIPERPVLTGSGCRWCLALPAHTARLNELMGSFKAKIGLKKRDRQMVASAAMNAGIPGATGKRRLLLTVVLAPRQRGGDPDCYQKSLGDSLVQCGLLRQDSREWVEWLPVQYARGDRAVMFVEMEDV